MKKQGHQGSDRLALKQAELDTRVEEVRRKKYAGVAPSEWRRLRQLEEENCKLKQIVADLRFGQRTRVRAIHRLLRKNWLD